MKHLRHRIKPHFRYNWGKGRPVLAVLPFAEGLVEEMRRDAAIAYVYRANGRDEEARRLSVRAMLIADLEATRMPV